MGNFRVIPKETKEQVLKRIKYDGITIIQAASEHGISDWTIRRWLREGTERSTTGVLLQNSKLKRENQALLELVGKLTLDLKVQKKKGND